MSAQDHLNSAQFYHATLGRPRRGSELSGEGSGSGYVYFGDLSTVRDHAETIRSKGRAPAIYEVRPLTEYERDKSLPSRQSYRTAGAVKILGRQE